MTSSSPGNAIVRENALPGTKGWQFPAGKAATTQIQAYASATSVLQKHSLTFYVSMQQGSTLYSIGIYRLGWYEGLGGRQVLFQPNQSGQAQGYYDYNNHRLVDCNSCKVNPQTGLVEANWQPSYTITVPPDWTTGIYLAKFIEANGMQTYVPFDVEGNFSSAYVAVTPDATDAAYNRWGGYSLYYDAYETPGTVIAPLQHGVKVSFDRPNTQIDGSAQVLYGEADAIHWLER